MLEVLKRGDIFPGTSPSTFLPLISLAIHNYYKEAYYGGIVGVLNTTTDPLHLLGDSESCEFKKQSSLTHNLPCHLSYMIK